MANVKVEREYSANFFLDRQAAVETAASAIVSWVVDLLHPKSVLDVGCGTGGWLAAFQRNGLADVLGMDGDWVPRDRLEIGGERLRVVDLGQPLKLNRRFDLAICLEVAEHLPLAAGDSLIRSLVSAAPVILFSAAIPHQGGTGHVNEQWPSYWITRFEREGFLCVDCLRPRFWADDRVAWWYSQNAFFFVAADAAEPLARLQAAAREFPLAKRAVVHPALYEAKIRELTNPLSYSLRRMLTVFPTLFFRAMRTRLGRDLR